MAEHPESERDDEQVRRWFIPLELDAAAVDADRLAGIRESSLGELAGAPDKSAAKNSAEVDSTKEESQAAESHSGNVSVRLTEHQPEGRRMLALATRALIGATALAITGFFLFFGGNGAEADSFGQVLDATRLAKTLHLQIVRDGDVADVWMKEGAGFVGRHLRRITGLPTAPRCGRSMKQRTPRDAATTRGSRRPLRTSIYSHCSASTKRPPY